MRTPTLLAVLGATLLPPAVAASEAPAARGDAVRGQLIFQMECASCHGLDGRGSPSWRKATSGKGLGAVPDLTDSAFMAQRSDAGLRKAIGKGYGGNGWIPGHSFRESLSTLDTWDVVQWLREQNLSIRQLFGEAARITAREFTIDEHGLKRIKETLGIPIERADQSAVVITVYGGPPTASGNIRLVPWNPVELDQLKGEDRLGFVVFTRLVPPGEKAAVPVGLAIGKDGALRKVVVRHADAKKAAEHEKALNAFAGQGERKPVALKAPKGAKGADKYEKPLARELARAEEAITMWDRSERDRTAFDR